MRGVGIRVFGRLGLEGGQVLESIGGGEAGCTCLLVNTRLV